MPIYKGEHSGLGGSDPTPRHLSGEGSDLLRASALIHQAHTLSKPHDVGYPPRFVHALDHAIKLARSHQTDGALLVFHLDNLAMILSAYGHEICENIMAQIQHDISTLVGTTDMVARLQRDEIGIIIHQTNPEDIAQLAERIECHVRQMGCYSPYGSLHMVCSTGMIMFPMQAITAQEALDRLFISRHVRAARSSHDATSMDMDRSADMNRHEMGLAHYLSKAIQEHRLRLAFQPIVCAQTGAIAHYEALLRMVSDDGKISSAGALIPIAERMGMIDTIDDTVLRMVVEELRRDPHVHLALNVSNMTTHNSKWLASFASYMQETPDIAPRLIVEITETAAQRDLRQTALFVADIQSHGAQVALDDFGSGYTSFRQLKTLSVDIVKIDGAFVRDLVDNADNRFFVKTLLEFTNGFGLKSVAEFVENGEVAKMLMELGVHYLQGYYLGKPETRRAWLSGGEYSKD